VVADPPVRQQLFSLALAEVFKLQNEGPSVLTLEVVGYANDDYALFEEECTFEH
jgi:hypothetical protein